MGYGVELDRGMATRIDADLNRLGRDPREQPQETAPLTVLHLACVLHGKVARARGLMGDVGIALRGPSPEIAKEPQPTSGPAIMAVLEEVSQQMNCLLREIEEARGLLGQPK